MRTEKIYIGTREELVAWFESWPRFSDWRVSDSNAAAEKKLADEGKDWVDPVAGSFRDQLKAISKFGYVTVRGFRKDGEERTRVQIYSLHVQITD